MPVYNRTHLVERAINSVLMQTYQDWELLIIDDGSEDNLYQLVLPLVDQNLNIRYIRQQHRGLAFSRNSGIFAALGVYVTFLDSDDEYLQDHLSIRVDFLKKHPHTDLIHGGVELYGPPETHYVQDAYNPDRKIHIKDCVVGATLFGKKSTFIRAGGFRNLSYSAESDLINRIIPHFHVVKVDYPTYRYYTGLDDSICAQRIKR